MAHNNQRRSRAEVSRILSTFSKSGMTQQAFADLEGIPLSTLTYWLRREREQPPSMCCSTKTPFVEVRVSDLETPSAPIRIELSSGLTLVISEGFSEVTLQRLLTLFNVDLPC